MMNNKELGAKLKELRLAKGLTLAEVGAEVGLTRAAVHKWEAGVARPKDATKHVLAELYGVDLGIFF